MEFWNDRSLISWVSYPPVLCVPSNLCARAHDLSFYTLKGIRIYIRLDLMSPSLFIGSLITSIAHSVVKFDLKKSSETVRARFSPLLVNDPCTLLYSNGGYTDISDRKNVSLAFHRHSIASIVHFYRF